MDVILSTSEETVRLLTATRHIPVRKVTGGNACPTNKGRYFFPHLQAGHSCLTSAESGPAPVNRQTGMLVPQNERQECLPYDLKDWNDLQEINRRS